MKPIVLIVEDEQDDILLLKRAFAKAAPQVAVRFAVDGELAVADLERASLPGVSPEHALPSLVVLDLKLPRKSGFEVLQWMRANPDTKNLPVFIRSSSSEPRDLERAYELGCNSYFTKDVNLSELFTFAECIGVYVRVQTRATLRLPLFGI